MQRLFAVVPLVSIMTWPTCARRSWRKSSGTWSVGPIALAGRRARARRSPASRRLPNAWSGVCAISRTPAPSGPTASPAGWPTPMRSVSPPARRRSSPRTATSLHAG